VFISHSAKDLDLIQPFVDFLRLAGDLREGEVFCTSVRGVPNGQFFIETILRALETSELIISLLTPEYFRSHFCIAEVGAAQLRQRAKRNRGDFFSLIVPPIAYEALSGVLFGLQSGTINSEKSLNELYAILQKLGSRVSPHGWQTARDAFLKKIAGPVERRELELLVNRKLTVLGAAPERLTAEQIRAMGIVFTRKFRITFRNDTGRAIKLKRASWLSESGDASPDPRPWWAFQHPKNEGKWAGDEKTLEVGHNRQFRVGVALDCNLALDDIEQRDLNERLGILELEVAMSDHTVIYRRRF